jgi:signal transduction histidine kinase
VKRKNTGLNSGRNIMWKLAGIYTLAIVVPGLILSLISIRTARHEEAFLEKQFQTTFSAELTQSVYSIEQILNEIQKMLDTTAPAKVSGEALAMWDSSVALVNVPFLFRRTGSFIWPDEKRVSGKEREFLTFNNDFFMDRKSVEVYRKITDEYMETILAAKGTDELPKKPLISQELIKQKAASDFEKDENVQQKVYSDLKRRGKFVPYRNVISGNKSSSKVEAYAPQLSTYVTESMRFSQIVSTASSGLIPRLIDEEMMLIYWKKSGQGQIIGCSIDLKKLSEQIASKLPQMLTSARFLTVLDQNGKSIFSDSIFTAQQWNKPFTAREVSRLLPRWEAVIYLVDPAQISSRARLTSLSLVSIAAILFLTILVSGFVLLMSIYSEIRLARQKTTFVTNVSHELKTPLTSIRIFAELLKEKRQPDPLKQEKYLGIMISEIERLTRLINNVLDFAKINKGTRNYSKKICDCVELCKDLVENQRVRLEHNKFTLETGYSDTPLPVFVDPEAIKQALLNVISNAEKYSSGEKWIRITVTSAAKVVTIAIADRGIGIDQSQSELIFKEFYRVDNSLTAKVQGTGLGLTITRQILRDHNGDIHYRKNEPSGSTFVIALPLYTES